MVQIDTSNLRTCLRIPAGYSALSGTLPPATSHVPTRYTQSWRNSFCYPTVSIPGPRVSGIEFYHIFTHCARFSLQMGFGLFPAPRGRVPCTILVSLPKTIICRVHSLIKGENMRKITAVWLCAMLMASSMLMVMDAGENAEAGTVVRNGVTYTTRAPIRITSNAEFNSANGVTGGDGTAGNPWIIEGYEINGGGSGNCIYFGETTDYFIVRNCRFYNANGNSGLYYWNTGVVLYKVQNGMISNNVIESNLEEGVYLWYSNNNIISNNTIYSNNGEGVDLWDSNNNKIISNTIYSNNGAGIYIYSCIGNQISLNTVYLNLGKGIRFLDSNSNNVSKNTLERNADGMAISSSSNNMISNNTVSQNTGSGIYLSSSGGNTVNNNSIELHNERGLYIMSSNSNTFYGNSLSLNKYGAYMSSSSSLNTLYHNNFIDKALTLNSF